jgi:hypothetical protein
MANPESEVPAPVSISDYREEPANGTILKSYNSGKLSCLGVPHSFSISDKVHELISRTIEEARPDVVCIEGVPPQLSTSDFVAIVSNYSIEEAVAKLGESASATKAALSVGACVQCPEPPIHYQVLHLIKSGIDEEDIFLYYMLRKLSSLSQNGLPLIVSFERAIKTFKQLIMCKQLIGNSLLDFSISTLNVLCIDRFNLALDRLPEAHVAELINPISTPPRGSEKGINDVAKKVTEYRDNSIIAELTALRACKKNVLMVYGCGHVMMQERLLRELYANPKPAPIWSFNESTNSFYKNL